MVGNPICVQMCWDKNSEALAKWANGQTGFPWIDAIMVNKIKFIVFDHRERFWYR